MNPQQAFSWFMAPMLGMAHLVAAPIQHMNPLWNPVYLAERQFAPLSPEQKGFDERQDVPQPLQQYVNGGPGYDYAREPWWNQVADWIPAVHNHSEYLGGTDQDPRTEKVTQRSLDAGPVHWDLGTQTSYLPAAPIHYSNLPYDLYNGSQPYEDPHVGPNGDYDSVVTHDYQQHQQDLIHSLLQGP